MVQVDTVLVSRIESHRDGVTVFQTAHGVYGVYSHSASHGVRVFVRVRVRRHAPGRSLLRCRRSMI